MDFLFAKFFLSHDSCCFRHDKSSTNFFIRLCAACSITRQIIYYFVFIRASRSLLMSNTRTKCLNVLVFLLVFDSFLIRNVTIDYMLILIIFLLLHIGTIFYRVLLQHMHCCVARFVGDLKLHL